ncbi:MAG: isoprenyl transferase [Lachnospiraceae bacterium]|nr:isoprenyl transferase [Lachnospiraceae bacterium]
MFKRKKKTDLSVENLTIPQHVAIILDGNGRWAKKRGLPRNLGHAQGFATVEKTVFHAADLGIKYLTVYGFSTENWKRPAEEVSGLMTLFRAYMKRLLKTALENDARVLMIGERSRFPQDIIDGINELEEKTKDNSRITFTIAINYGGRDEITRAVNKMIQEAKDGTLTEPVTEQVLAQHLDTKLIPDPDLLIRTSGEQRLSNYLIWQSAYAELYFTDVLWPDFSKEDLIEAIRYYNTRDRRFGGLSKK